MVLAKNCLVTISIIVFYIFRCKLSVNLSLPLFYFLTFFTSLLSSLFLIFAYLYIISGMMMTKLTWRVLNSTVPSCTHQSNQLNKHCDQVNIYKSQDITKNKNICQNMDLSQKNTSVIMMLLLRWWCSAEGHKGHHPTTSAKATTARVQGRDSRAEVGSGATFLTKGNSSSVIFEHWSRVMLLLRFWRVGSCVCRALQCCPS